MIASIDAGVDESESSSSDDPIDQMYHSRRKKEESSKVAIRLCDRSDQWDPWMMNFQAQLKRSDEAW